jgi:23S rRNA pseudouridine2605 synthase
MKRKPDTDTAHLVRLNRYLSMCGISSRRKADQLIQEGRVEVDRCVIRDLGTKIDPERSTVYVDGKRALQSASQLYLMLNKPKDTITTLHDERGRATVMSLIRSKGRVYPIGRLDRNTTGVLLFTNDGEFAHRLMHPKFEIPKSYAVTTDRKVMREHVEQLRTGIHLRDGPTAPAEVVVIPGSGGKKIGIVIHEGRNRQVRHMFEVLGYEVKSLDRVAYGPVTKEGLARGETRSLTRAEVRALERMAGIEEKYR